MTPDEAIKKLDALTDEHPQDTHERADRIFAQAVRENGLPDLADAYERACRRLPFLV